MKYANDQTKALRRSILWRTIINAVLFTAAFGFVFLFIEAFLKTSLSNFVFYSLMGGMNYTVYNVLSSLYYLLAVLGYLTGLILVIRAGINRALRYFDALFEAVEGMFDDDGEPISLPPDLSATALALNGIQMERERSNRAAKAAEQRKNELVVYLAHDIKTPLTSIIGYLTMLSESPDMPIETRARYASITLEKAYRLEELIEEFFEITRYNLQTIPIERSRFDAVLFCQQVIDEFYPQAQARFLAIELEAPDELPTFADANRLSRVFNNVLKNALSYADEGSTVLVRVSESATDQVKWLKIVVTNEGREITPEHLDRIFEKFYRGDDARTTASGGAGLGLAIAREIARAHGGDITAASKNGMTSFAVWIPQAGY
ncbi:sensor histidine kinase [Raoultibacter phocaeensis]|uniref:sensor histidine kinase n=1 Tax=Raoultibacter phocaeensis TaxID=2479841 RepID=UPI001119CFC1|nr:HAMP domain-containing sensor histidine kinase [Raoultibacter phocaeensis]